MAKNIANFHLDYFTDLSASIEKFSDKLNKQPNLDDNIVIDNESLKDYREYESAYFLEFKIMAVNFNPSTWDGSYLSRLNDLDKILDHYEKAIGRSFLEGKEIPSVITYDNPRKTELEEAMNPFPKNITDLITIKRERKLDQKKVEEFIISSLSEYKKIQEKKADYTEKFKKGVKTVLEIASRRINNLENKAVLLMPYFCTCSIPTMQC